MTSAPPDTYIHGHHDSVLRSHRWRTVDNSATYLLRVLEPDMDVLDVGCGPGSVTLDIAERLREGRVVGIDSEGAVLDEARAEAARRGLTNAIFQVGDLAILTAMVEGDGVTQAEAYGDAAPIAAAVDEVLKSEARSVGRVTTAELVVQPREHWDLGQLVRTGWLARRRSVIEVRADYGERLD